MLRRLFIILLAGISFAGVLATDAFAQRRDDDRYFFLRDPFGRGRGLFDFPDRPAPPKPAYVEPPSDEPVGTVYGSSTDADSQRFLNASEYVLVLGDTLAEQLSQGLADEFVSERPEVAIVKKTKNNTGFVRTDIYDWTAQASALLAKEKATAIVVLLGINDRQPLRDDSKIEEFRSDRWREIYGKRVEDFLVKLKDKNVPIFVMGLPPVRSPKMSLDAVYLNEILSERTRKVGGYFIDAWDGFVAENGDFMATGPALDGQTRRLRASDGVHFTKAGQRKLAHYAERELLRLFDARPGRDAAIAAGREPGTAGAGGGAAFGAERAAGGGTGGSALAGFGRGWRARGRAGDRFAHPGESADDRPESRAHARRGKAGRGGVGTRGRFSVASARGRRNACRARQCSRESGRTRCCSVAGRSRRRAAGRAGGASIDYR